MHVQDKVQSYYGNENTLEQPNTYVLTYLARTWSNNICQITSPKILSIQS